MGPWEQCSPSADLGQQRAMSAHPFCQTFSKTSVLGAAEKGAGGHRQGRRAWWCAWVRVRLATAGDKQTSEGVNGWVEMANGGWRIDK
jgi:hypothetical protein